MNDTYDVVVVGSGAGGLSAAAAAAHGGASVLLVEKEKVCGGATAWSGGWMWTPRHRFARAAGVVEDVEAPLTYLRHRLGENFDETRVRAFLEGAPRMVDFFHEHTALQFVPGERNADIYGDTPGAASGHRQVAPEPVRLTRLGADVARLLRRQMYETSFLGMGIMAGPDLQAFLHATRSPRAFVHCAGRVTRHLLDLVVHRRGQSLVNGTALVGRLLRSALDAGVDIRVNTAAVELRTDGGRVTGIVLDGPQGRTEVTTRRGVVLATGGFSHDIKRRRAIFPARPGPADHHSLPPRGAGTGDGVRLAEAVGGRLDTAPASPVAYCPVSLIRLPGRTGTFPHILDRGKPGVIGVLADGRRFVNEANGYHDYGSAMVAAAAEGGPVRSWLVADARYLRHLPLGMSKPFPVPTWTYRATGYLRRGRTLGELARACGIDPEGLVRTVEEFNAGARQGDDPVFGRGATPFNRASGDPDNPWPNPSLAPLERAPFYAVEVLSGSFGTFAGLATDADSRVLRADDSVVEGLFAVGVDQSSVMGGHYPSGGINIGPAMTFGYLTGERLGAAAGAGTVSTS